MRRLQQGLALVAALALFLMMALTFVDVIGRKFLDSSLTGSVELTELLMLAVIFVAMPLTSLHGEHVIFDLLDKFLSQGLRAAQHRIANLLCVLVVGGAAVLVFQRAARTVEQGDTTAQLLLPLGNFYHAVALTLVFTALMHVVLALRPAPQDEGEGVVSAEIDHA